MIIIVRMAFFLRRNRDHTASYYMVNGAVAGASIQIIVPNIANFATIPLNICTTCKASSVTARVLGRYPS